MSRRIVRRRSRGRVMTRFSILFGTGLACLTGIAVLVSGCASSKPVAATEGSDGVQTVKVTVKHGYSPSVIEAKAGKPLKIEFYRDEEAGAESCDKDLVIPSENVSIPLPVHESQIVEIKPHSAGEIDFQCGMNMMKGKIRFKES